MREVVFPIARWCPDANVMRRNRTHDTSIQHGVQRSPRLSVYRLHSGTHSRRRSMLGFVSLPEIVSARSEAVDLRCAFLAQRLGRATVAALLHISRVERSGCSRADPRMRHLSIWRHGVERDEPLAHG